MAENDIYNDGNAPINGQPIGVTLNKILGEVRGGAGGGGVTPPPSGQNFLSVNETTGEITNPVTAEQFVTGNDLVSDNPAINALTSLQYNFVFVGDSITEGNHVTPTTTFPYYCSQMSFFEGRGTVYNFGDSGATLADLTAAYVAQVHPYAPNTTGIPAYLFVQIGTNDYKTIPSATWITSWDAYLNTAISDGFTIIAFTVTGSSSDSAANTDNRYSINNLIRRSTLWNGLIEFANLAPNTLQSVFYSDGLHPTALLNYILSGVINSTLLAQARYPFPQMLNSAYSLDSQGNGEVRVNGLTVRLANSLPMTVNSSVDTNALALVRTDASTSTVRIVESNLVISAGDMVDGFGAGISFQLQDTAGVVNNIGHIAGVRAGADDTGDIVFFPRTTGTANERFRITSAGNGTLTGGDLSVATIGRTLRIRSGSNALSGTVTLTAGAGTISSTAIDTNTVIILSLKTVGGTILSQPYVATITPGTGCTIAGGGGANTSVYNWIGLKVN